MSSSPLSVVWTVVVVRQEDGLVEQLHGVGDVLRHHVDIGEAGLLLGECLLLRLNTVAGLGGVLGSMLRPGAAAEVLPDDPAVRGLFRAVVVPSTSALLPGHGRLLSCATYAPSPRHHRLPTYQK